MIKTWSMVVFLVLVDAMGNVFLTKGMKQVGEVGSLKARELLRLGRRAITNYALGLGVLCMALTFFTFLALLSRERISFVFPITALGYVLSVVGAKYFLKEQVSWSRWIGTLIICLGVALISLDPTAG